MSILKGGFKMKILKICSNCRYCKDNYCYYLKKVKTNEFSPITGQTYKEMDIDDLLFGGKHSSLRDAMKEANKDLKCPYFKYKIKWGSLGHSVLSYMIITALFFAVLFDYTDRRDISYALFVTTVSLLLLKSLFTKRNS